MQCSNIACFTVVAWIAVYHTRALIKMISLEAVNIMQAINVKEDILIESSKEILRMPHVAAHAKTR